MEEQVQVKEVEAKEEVSTQEKEAAVLEKAVESGEVDSNYGFQEDGVYRVNVDAPPKKEENRYYRNWYSCKLCCICSRSKWR